VILVDTGAWFAAAVRNDPDHEAAMRWLERNREPLVTTDYILAETTTLLCMRDKTVRGYRLAVRVAPSLLHGEAALLEKVNGEDLKRALEVFRTYRDHLFSFVDDLPRRTSPLIGNASRRSALRGRSVVRGGRRSIGAGMKLSVSSLPPGTVAPVHIDRTAHARR
jgi:uncharacterized protein